MQFIMLCSESNDKSVFTKHNLLQGAKLEMSIYLSASIADPSSKISWTMSIFCCFSTDLDDESVDFLLKKL